MEMSLFLIILAVAIPVVGLLCLFNWLQKVKSGPTTLIAAAVCVGVIVVALIVFVHLHLTDPPRSHASPPREKTRDEGVAACFSAWDGSHRGVTKIIKESMNDPKSYEHVETKYSDQGDYLIVITKFRGKNAFGGTVLNWVKAKVDLDGNVIAVLEQGP